MKNLGSRPGILGVLFKAFTFGIKVVFISLYGLVGLVVVPISWVLAILYIRFRPELFYRIVARWLYFVERALFSLTVEGKENLPEDNFILIAPHQSYWDIPVLCYAIGPKRPLTFIARKGFFFLKWEPLSDFCIFIDRDNTKMKRLIRKSKAALKERPLAIFPEGSTHVEAKQVKGFALMLAQMTGKKVVPLRIKSKGPYGKPGGGTLSYLTRQVNLTVEIQKPLSMEDIKEAVPQENGEKSSAYRKRATKKLLNIE